ncbi:hypothetical protein [Nocardia cyriacigeorgica]|uniref:hypothetical protein n=1 Tax=Nocardia cyriacigeorgica TaxID=135487 RepID=UPI001894F688|nr:hypothetical protein [Nocardia cyriacigeorgica]MBF6439575.1 hypothetical protein [Nocardia cyriacigeorgica]
MSEQYVDLLPRTDSPPKQGPPSLAGFIRDRCEHATGSAATGQHPYVGVACMFSDCCHNPGSHLSSKRSDISHEFWCNADEYAVTTLAATVHPPSL